jgi:hypothetical protein
MKSLNLPVDGGCQCGSCTYTLSAAPFVAYACHCIECQKLTSSAFLSCLHAPSEAVQISRGSPHTRERTADSGSTLTTWFCASCGSTLFAKNSSRPRVLTIHVGSLESRREVPITAHIWTKRKVKWVTLPNDHRVFEENGDWTEDYAQDPSRYRTDLQDKAT